MPECLPRLNSSMVWSPSAGQRPCPAPTTMSHRQPTHRRTWRIASAWKCPASIVDRKLQSDNVSGPNCPKPHPGTAIYPRWRALAASGRDCSCWLNSSLDYAIH